MSLRLALLVCLLGVVAGGGIAILPEVLSPPAAARANGASIVLPASGRGKALPAQVAIRVNPPRLRQLPIAGLLAAIDRDHKGYVTMDDINAYYEARRTSSGVPGLIAR